VTDPQPVDRTDTSSPRPTVDELASAKGMKPVRSLNDLQEYGVRLFDSDEEVEEFLAVVRAVRHADLS
jgi:hypothetical protein